MWLLPRQDREALEFKKYLPSGRKRTHARIIRDLFVVGRY